MDHKRLIALLLSLAAAIALWAWLGRAGPPADVDDALPGEARRGGVTVRLDDPVPDVAITQARAPGRPIVLLDPGHGGNDPGARGVSGAIAEKDLALALAIEVRDRLAKRGVVRVALTRDRDRTLSLEQRAGIARRIGAALFVSIHMDSAANALARGTSVYSLSDVASDAEAARFAAAENRAGGSFTSERESSVRYLLADLALRDQMADSAALAGRLIAAGRGTVLLRPEPHRFAAFHVLRRSGVPGALVEAGYISNAEDEAALMTPQGRAPLVEALARALETEAALQRTR
jgi:N-acetylmuramoyl-L-alanine amidase